MQKVYTKSNGAYVFPRVQDLKTVKPDSCAVRIIGDKPCVLPLGSLRGKQVEGDSYHGYSSLWGYNDDKNDPYILINGEKKRAKFCDFCQDRLNGITGNCLNKNIKPSGCSFQPVPELKPFEINLEGWKEIREIDLNTHTPFYKPHLSGIKFDPKLIKKNRKTRLIARHLPEEQERKIEKYCSRCIYQGTCTLDSRKIAEHCMVTEDVMIKQCLSNIRRKFGGVEAYLNMLAYAGGKFKYKPEGYVQESEWRVSQPFNKKQYEIIAPYNCFGDLKVTREFVEDSVKPLPLPVKNREKIAALAWYYLDRYHFHRLWISLKENGIEVTHRVHRRNHFFRPETFTSFNEIHYFFNR